MIPIRLLAALLSWAAFCAGAHAQETSATTTAKARPRVALVLSGGGARGFAHIGVLRSLREQRIPIDMVVGTSMGSVVGGAFAAGASVPELEAMARDTDWDALLSDRPPRNDLTYRRREEDLLLPSRIEFGVSRAGATLPPAAASNAALEAALDRMLPPGTRQVPVHQLPLPFRSVASDLLTGELVELTQTPLFMAMRASLAVPGVFAPVRVEKRLLVDGGLVRNLPVDMARAMGADIIIAVNVGTPLSPEKDLDSAIGVARQMINILTEQNVQRSISELRPQDVLVAPNLTGIGFMDFTSHARAIAAGEAAARALAPKLAALALPAEEYALLEDRRLAAPGLADGALPLGSVNVSADGDLNPATLVAQTGMTPGASLTRDAVRKAADLLYGRGDIARVETEVVDEGGARHVRVRAAEALWANNRVRLGLELASDFGDINTFALKLMHVKTSLNRWGGELRSVARIGSEREVGMQLWQPLGAGSPWYLMPALEWSSSGADVFAEGRRVARIGYRTGAAAITFGRELGNWGDIQAGITRHKVGLRVTIPEDPSQPNTALYDTTQFLRYRIDTLDVLGFPTRGMLVDAHLERSPGSGDGQDGRLAQSTVLALRAFRRGDWAGHVYGEWSHAHDGTAPLSLGGFLRLSGTVPNSLDGRTVLFGRVAMARKVGALPTTLGGNVRAGFSLEAGAVYNRIESDRHSKVRQAGSVYLSVDTRFGPAYLGAGATKDGEATLYLFLGPVW